MNYGTHAYDRRKKNKIGIQKKKGYKEKKNKITDTRDGKEFCKVMTSW